MSSLDSLQQGVMALVFIAVLAAAGAIALDAFQNDVQLCSDSAGTANSWIFNSSDRLCHNYTVNNATVGGTSAAYNITGDGLDGLTNATGFLDTIGTLMGVAALIAVVVGAFFFFRR